MDPEARLEQILDRAVELGLLEDRGGGDLRATKRWKDALVRASAEMALEAAECPTCPPPPDPVGDAVRRALQALAPPIGTTEWDEIIAVLAQFELATMPAAKRTQSGYAAEWPPR